ncbi:MAG: Ku protein [Acetobacterales bacterium]
MAAPRIYWKGRLRLSLVSIEIALYAATERKANLTLRQIHEPTGKRVRYDKVVPGHGPVDSDEIVKGFELDDDNYVILEPEELDKIKLETRDTIQLVQFVKHSEIDPRFFERPYYVAPQDDGSEEGFVVIRQALHDAGKVGLGQMAMRGREYLVALMPCGRGLLLQTLRYANEVRDSEQVFDDIPDLDVDKEMLDLAGELIERKSAPFDPSKFKDSYSTALRQLIEEKRKNAVVIDEGGGRRQSAEVIDLMEALKKSVDSGDQNKRRSNRKSSSSSSGKRSSGKKSGSDRSASGSRRKAG